MYPETNRLFLNYNVCKGYYRKIVFSVKVAIYPRYVNKYLDLKKNFH